MDELKNENIQTRINAIRRIQSISKTLGPQNTCSMLLPALHGMLAILALLGILFRFNS